MYCSECGVSNPEGAATCRVCGRGLAGKPSPYACPSCGADSQENQSHCTKCGARLPRRKKTEPAVASSTGFPEPTAAAWTAEAPTPDATAMAEPAPDQPAEVTSNACPICGRPKDMSADLCEYCSRPETGDSGDYDSETTYGSEMDLPMIGGLLIITAGVLGIAHGLLTFEKVSSYGLPLVVSCVTLLMVIFGLVAILGGISAMGRMNAIYAVLGGVFGLLSVGFYIGAVMSVVGLVLIMSSYDKFKVKELSLDLLR